MESENELHGLMDDDAIEIMITTNAGNNTLGQQLEADLIATLCI